MAEVTPMVKQYLDIKEQHKDAVLFFRLGDFYEMFFDDALNVSRELELTLTGRGKKDDGSRIPMCGIPYHAAENYIARLVNKGYKIAVCEQVEDPALAKGLTKREVIKVITPGTVTSENVLKERANNYLVAVNGQRSMVNGVERSTYGLALVDSSTGEFKVTELEREEDLISELNRLQPVELIVDAPQTFTAKFPDLLITIRPFQSVDRSKKALMDLYHVSSLEGFGCADMPTALTAAHAITSYLQETQRTAATHLKTMGAYYPSDFMYLDKATRRNLELTETMREKDFKGSLLSVLDKTRTAMGARLLKQWLTQPLLDKKAIIVRQDAIAELVDDIICREELSAFLQQIYDLERIMGRVALGTVSPRDLISLKESLSLLPDLKSSLSVKTSPLLNALDEKALGTAKAICDLITQAIVDVPPLKITEGNIIKEGYDPELDELKKLSRGGKEWVAALEQKERDRTGIRSLKVGYTKVFGYFIEVTNSNLSQVPADYIRKQTLTNGERFITPDLKDKEAQILQASEQAEKKEHEIFTKIRGMISEHTPVIQTIAEVLSRIDVLLSLATVAVNNDYCRPEILDKGSGTLELYDSRHPVLEQTTGMRSFIPNDCVMDEQEHRFMLITGPNMAGKSTYMRQVALIVLMAQIGSFVPAKRARISLVTRIFTRVGASDDLASGHSTFMVEMTETANILNLADEHSLLILDEIGRGTSTYDGMSIAWAVAEYIHMKIKAKTLFATHYHEMVKLESQFKGIKNFNVAVKEQGDTIVFLHKLIPGGADRSYGIHVAQMAGLPGEVIGRAKEILSGLEDGSSSSIEDKKTRQLTMF